MTVFQCATENCTYAIASSDFNAVQLKAVKKWPKPCPQCGKRTMWTEQGELINTKTISNQTEAGNEEFSTKNTTKSASQKQRAARHDGLH